MREVHNNYVGLAAIGSLVLGIVVSLSIGKAVLDSRWRYACLRAGVGWYEAKTGEFRVDVPPESPRQAEMSR